MDTFATMFIIEKTYFFTDLLSDQNMLMIAILDDLPMQNTFMELMLDEIANICIAVELMINDVIIYTTAVFVVPVPFACDVFDSKTNPTVSSINNIPKKNDTLK
jgi:hypothetical protein